MFQRVRSGVSAPESGRVRVAVYSCKQLSCKGGAFIGELFDMSRRCDTNSAGRPALAQPQKTFTITDCTGRTIQPERRRTRGDGCVKERCLSDGHPAKSLTSAPRAYRSL